MPLRHSIAGAIALCVMGLTFFACSSTEEKSNLPVRFPYTTPPTILGPDEAPVYFAEHFWERYLSPSWTYPSDTSMVRGVANVKLEEAVSSYVRILSTIELDKADNIVRKFTETLIATEVADTASVVFEKVSSLFERYAFDPNSPIRDEDIYGAYASVMSGCTLIPIERRESYAQDARLCALNRRGTVATNFRFTYRDGRVSRLLDIHAQYTILFFSNPGCTACKEIIETLSGDRKITKMIELGILAVVNIYIDEDMQGWLKYMPIYPKEWHNVFDQNGVIRSEELYNIRAIPSLYLLNSNKVVILKDATPQALYNRISRIYVEP